MALLLLYMLSWVCSACAARSVLHIVTDAALGGTLLEYVAEHAAFTESTLRELSRQLLQALAFCHDSHVAHRDVKPDNIMLRAPPGPTPEHEPSIMLVDFGSAIFCYGDVSVAAAGFHGTPFYAAPEIFGRELYGTQAPAPSHPPEQSLPSSSLHILPHELPTALPAG